MQFKSSLANVDQNQLGQISIQTEPDELDITAQGQQGPAPHYAAARSH